MSAIFVRVPRTEHNMTEILGNIFTYFLSLFIIRVMVGQAEFERRVFLYPVLALFGTLIGAAGYRWLTSL